VSDPGFPAVYYGSDKKPLPWQNDVGDLRPTVEAFLRLEHVSGAQFALLRAYLVYCINAPCWTAKPAEDRSPLEPSIQRIQELRSEALQVRTVIDIWAFLADCLEAAIDLL
jgi:hypothetical protein